MLGRGQGISAWYNSLGMVPNAAGNFMARLGDAAEANAERQREENAREQARRDKRTAERKQRQALTTQIGVGVGGALAGAGLGAALAAPAAAATAAPAAAAAAGTVPAEAAAILGTSTLGELAATAPVATAVSGGVGAGAGGGLGAAGGAAVGGGVGGGIGAAGGTALKPAFEDPGFGSGVTQGGSSFVPDGGTYIDAPGNSSVGGSTFQPNPTYSPPTTQPTLSGNPRGLQPTAEGFDPNMVANAGASDNTRVSRLFQQKGLASGNAIPELRSTSTPRFGILGDNRGQVFGNLFLRGLANQIPGVGGVVSGIDAANQYNYQTSRDATTDAFRNRSLGLQEQGLSDRKAYYDQRLQQGGGRAVGPGSLQRDVEFAQTLGIDPRVAAERRLGLNPAAPVINPLDIIKVRVQSWGDPAIWSRDPAKVAELNQMLSGLEGGGLPQGNQASSGAISILDEALRSGEITQQEYDEERRRRGL